MSSDFPSLKSRFAYLDSASTSLTPQVVIDAMDTYYKEYRASTHRGMYESATRATKEFEEVRKKVANFIDAQESEIIFTSGSTAAAQLLIATLEHNLDLQEGDEILVTELDHHATLVPLQQLAKRKKMILRVVPVNADWQIEESVLKTFLNERTKIISLIHGSNVVGTILPIDTLIKRARDTNAFVVVDAAQTAGHIPVSFKNCDADALFFSGHKMCGPTGVGALVLKEKWIQTFVPPYGGGGTVSSVSKEKTFFLENNKKFEAGTPPIAEVIGLGAAIDYLAINTFEKLAEHTQEVLRYARKTLGGLPYVQVFSGKENVGVVSFVVPGVHPHDVAHILGEAGVAVRAGFQCAELVARKLSENGIVRASVYGYTTKEDIDALIEGLKKVATTFSL
ncbi:MAG: cysteine desulfurase [Minisyncoccia bacterium]